MKIKKYILIPIIIILCMICYAILVKPTIENRTWGLSYAQQTKPLFVVAHDADYDLSDNDSPLFATSKPVKVTLEAKNGKLILTDITNNKTYQGSYKITSWKRFQLQRYDVVIDGVEGNANISSKYGKSLFVSIGDYYLSFMAE